MGILAWHFLPDDGRLSRPLNGERVKVEPGQTLKVPGRLEICRHGLHASRRLIDALEYTPGVLLERVELSGDMIEEEDKLCARERTCLWLLDCTDLLHEFACRCAEDALRVAGVSDERCWNAIKAKREWLKGAIDDDELRAVRETAWNAAYRAAKNAAQFAAWNAVWDAAEDTAWNAAWYAAWNTAQIATWDVERTWSAERNRQNRRLTAMVVAAHKATRR